MSDETAIVESDQPILLNEREQAVAFWLANSSVPGDETILTYRELAERLGCSRNTITMDARKPQVRAVAREMIKDIVEFERLPKILANVFVAAENDAKFGLQVLKWLQEWGIDPLLGEQRRPESTKQPSQHVHFHAPGGIEASIRAMRGEE